MARCIRFALFISTNQKHAHMNQAGCINYLCSDKEHRPRSDRNGTYFKRNFLSAVNVMKMITAVGKKDEKKVNMIPQYSPTHWHFVVFL